MYFTNPPLTLWINKRRASGNHRVSRISGFRRSADQICTLLPYYAA